MKNLLIFLLICLPVWGWGQDDLYGQKETKSKKPAEPFAIRAASTDSVQSWVYCEIIGTQKLLSTKVSVEIDYGQRRKWFSDQRIRDEEGTVKNFNSMVDAMNYLGANGWEFVQAYAASTGNQNVYHWLLRSDLSNPIFLPDVKK